MLVLTRKIGESLMIGDNIKLTVVGVKSGQVRLGIDAPKEIQIQREELLRVESDSDSMLPTMLKESVK